MLRPRVIPCLLLRNNGFVKTVNFKNPTYLGDPINIIKIFNEKEVDELIILDILASKENKDPNLKLIEQIVSEAFMPVCYGGGIRTSEQIKDLLAIGVEKVAINTNAIKNINLISDASEKFGNQCIVGAIDIKKNFFNKASVYSANNEKVHITNVVEWSKILVKYGAGELLLNSVDNDGMMSGYDLNIIKAVTQEVSVPVIACGGAGNIRHFKQAINEAAVSAVAAGSFFVFHGKHKGVLISYLDQNEIMEL